MDGGNDYLTRREWALWLDAHGHVHETTNAQLNKAEQAMERRLEGMNEFRQSLRDQSSTFMTRDMGDARFASLGDKIDAVDNRINMQERWRAGIDGRTIGAAAAVSLTVTIIGLVVSLGLR